MTGLSVPGRLSELLRGFYEGGQRITLTTTNYNNCSKIIRNLDTGGAVYLIVISVVKFLLAWTKHVE